MHRWARRGTLALAAPEPFVILWPGAGRDMQRGTQPDIVPLHATAERTRAGQLRGARLGVIRQLALLRLPPPASWLSTIDVIRSMGRAGGSVPVAPPTETGSLAGNVCASARSTWASRAAASRLSFADLRLLAFAGAGDLCVVAAIP